MRPQRQLKKPKGLRRFLSSMKPYPRKDAGEIRQAGNTIYQIQPNGEWKRLEKLTEAQVSASKNISSEAIEKLQQLRKAIQNALS